MSIVVLRSGSVTSQLTRAGPDLCASHCRINWGNGFFAACGPTTSARCVVDHYAGKGVTIQITAGASVTTTFQAAGTSVMYSLGTPGAAVTRRIDVLNGSSDSFHVGCNWGN